MFKEYTTRKAKTLATVIDCSKHCTGLTDDEVAHARFHRIGEDVARALYLTRPRPWFFMGKGRGIIRFVIRPTNSSLSEDQLKKRALHASQLLADEDLKQLEPQLTPLLERLYQATQRRVKLMPGCADTLGHPTLCVDLLSAA